MTPNIARLGRRRGGPNGFLCSCCSSSLHNSRKRASPTCRVVASVLEALEPFKKDLQNRLPRNRYVVVQISKYACNREQTTMWLASHSCDRRRQLHGLGPEAGRGARYEPTIRLIAGHSECQSTVNAVATQKKHELNAKEDTGRLDCNTRTLRSGAASARRLATTTTKKHEQCSCAINSKPLQRRSTCVPHRAR